MKKTVLILTLFLAIVPTFRAASAKSADDDQKIEFTADQIAKLCRWYIGSTMTDDKENVELHQAAATAILKFAADTEDFSIEIGNEFLKLFDLSKNTPGIADMNVTYLAAQVLYCIETGAKKNDEQSYVFSVLAVLKHYAANKTYDGNFESLDALLALPEGERPGAIKVLYLKYVQTN